MSLAESDIPLEIGSTVNMIKWDATVPAHARIGPATVVCCWRSNHCESGWMVLVRTKRGDHRLDSHWID